MSIIKIENLKRTYGTKVLTHALKGVSFEVSEGDFIIIMGKSGSGKSTLLHQLGLLDTPTSGEIFIRNENTTPIPKNINFTDSAIKFTSIFFSMVTTCKYQRNNI